MGHSLNQYLIIRYLFILSFVFPKNGLALSEIDQFLSLAQRDISVLQSQGLRDSHLQQELSSAWLEDMELRINYNDVEFDKGEYALRFRPKPISQIEAESKMYQLEGKLNGIEYLNALSEALRERYKALIKIFHQNQLIDLSVRWVRLLEAKVEAYRELSGSEQFKFLDLIDAERQLSKRTLRHLEYQHSLDDTLKGFEITPILRELILRGDWLCTSHDLINFVNIEMDISGHGESNSLLKGKEYAIKLAEQEYFLQQNKSGPSFSFFQFGYDYGNEKSGEISLAAGFKIPLPGSEKRSVTKSRLRLLSVKNEKIMLQQKLNFEIDRLKQQLFNTYDTLAALEREFRRGNDYVLKSQDNIVSPIVLMEVKEK